MKISREIYAAGDDEARLLDQIVGALQNADNVVADPDPQCVRGLRAGPYFAVSISVRRVAIPKKAEKVTPEAA